LLRRGRRSEQRAEKNEKECPDHATSPSSHRKPSWWLRA